MGRPRFVGAVAAGAASVLLAACAQAHPASETPALTTAGAPASSATASDAAPAGTCAALAGTLSVQEQAGLVVLVGLPGAPDAGLTALLARDHVGGVVLTASFRTGVAGVKAITAPLAASGLLVAVAQEGGAHQPLSGAGFDTVPSAAQQGKLAPAELRTKWATWGGQLKAAGVNVDLAPAGDVLSAANQARSVAAGTWDRLYGADPTAVASSVIAAAAGLRQAGVATAVTHFPGLGALPSAAESTTSGPATDTVTTGASAALSPYAAAAGAGVDAVTVSTATYAQLDAASPAVFSVAVVRLLRDDLRFGGVIVSDDLAAASVASVPPAQRLLRFVKAGGDLAVVSDAGQVDAMVTGLAGAASDPAVAARLTAAATNVLALKSWAGLAECVAAKG